MTELAQYLLDHYYSKYKGTRTDVVPTAEQIETGYKVHKDKFIIVRDENIQGVAIFVTLTDETYSMLESMDITQVDILSRLLAESGDNVHFVLLCAGGVKIIMSGVKEAKRRVNPKTISWWNPDLTYLHKYNLRG